jgi:hypothetical protein
MLVRCGVRRSAECTCGRKTPTKQQQFDPQLAFADVGGNALADFCQHPGRLYF